MKSIMVKNLSLRGQLTRQPRYTKRIARSAPTARQTYRRLVATRMSENDYGN